LKSRGNTTKPGNYRNKKNDGKTNNTYIKIQLTDNASFSTHDVFNRFYSHSAFSRTAPLTRIGLMSFFFTPK